jgi:hypothetical protein
MGQHPELTFFVNEEAIVIHAASLTVREILDDAGITPTDHRLFEHVDGREVELGGLDEHVALREGARFTARLRHYCIVVNGREKTVDHRVLTFAEVVALAPNLPPPGPGVEYRVTFRDAVDPKEGDLIPGESVRIKDGTEFVVSATNRS